MKKRGRTCARRPLCSPCAEFLSRRKRPSLVLRREVEMVAPLAFDQRRLEPGPPLRRPTRVFFPSSSSFFNVIRFPRFILERRCSRRR
jgi:hypothetical protein